MRLLYLAIMLMLPLHVWAQGATVQTGEHQNFTRVVITIPQDADWRLGRNEDGYLLHVPGIGGYSLGRFFDLIPRRRILDAQMGSDDDMLQLVVSCQCYMDAFVDSPSILVLDVRSGIAPVNAQFEQPIDSLPAVSIPSTPQGPVTGRYFASQNRLLPLLFERDVAINRTWPEDTSVRIGPGGADDLRDDAPDLISEGDEADQNTDLQALEQSITESLARGLSQGVLVPDIDQVGAAQATQPTQGVLSPGIEVRTSTDLTAIPPSERSVQTQNGETCPPDSFFDIASWGDDLPFSDQLGRQRATLVGEFDRFDETSVLRQAQLFVHFGFGREAAQALQLDGVLSQERQFLLGVAQIIDRDPITPGLFDNLISCQSSVALWALLAASDDGLDGQVDPASVLGAFKALPRHLQTHLGPRVSERFLAIGDEDSALQSLTPAVANAVPTVEAQLAEAELLQDLGESELATQSLTQLARGKSRTTPEAMTAFLQASIREGFSVSDEDFALVDALRFENAMTSGVQNLARAQMRAYLHQDAFDLALQLKDEFEVSDEPANYADVIDELAMALAERGEDMRFLEFAFNMSETDFTPITTLSIAQRLLALGFPEQVNQILAEAQFMDESVERRYLLAEAALMMGDAEAALSSLEGLTTPRASALTEAAQLLAQGTAFSRDEQQDLDVPVRSWRRGDWAALSSSDDALLRDVSSAVMDASLPEITPNTPLATGRELLERSAQSRDVVDRLLQRFEVQSDF